MFSRLIQSSTWLRLVVLFTAIFAVAGKAKADTITFDQPASPGSVALNQASFQGFDFSSVDGFNHVASGTFSAAVSNNGTSFLVVANNATGALNMSNNGSTFSLTGFDADTFVHIQGATTIVATGTLGNGGTITQTFLTDAIGDGPGPLVDFQTFALNGFTDVTSVQFSSTNHPFALDNIGVSAAASSVPEPASMLLLGTGIMGLGSIVRRRRKL
jgi:hypothetical protein